MDFALTWIPVDFGNQEWEFATVTQSFNGLPILLLGLGLLTVASEQVHRRWWAILGIVGTGVLLVAAMALSASPVFAGVGWSWSWMDACGGSNFETCMSVS